MNLIARTIGNGEPLLLVHPTAGAWAPIVPLLAEHHEVITVDLPGFGSSAQLAAGELPTVPRLADAVAWQVRALGHHRPHIVGNSLGGAVALEMARRGIAASLVTISPTGLGTPSESRRSLRRLRWVRAVSPLGRPFVRLFGRWAAARAVIGGLGMTLGRPWRHQRSEMIAAIDDFWRAPGFTAFELAIAHRPGGLEHITCPVTIIWGRRDLILPVRQADRFAARMPHATVRLLKGGGHFPMSDDPQHLVEFILQTTAQARTQSRGVGQGNLPPLPQSGVTDWLASGHAPA